MAKLFHTLKNNQILPEIIWWALALGLTAGIAANTISGFDWISFYYPRANGDIYASLYNPLWIYLVIKPLALLPLRSSFVVFTLLNVAMLRFGSYLSGANKFWLLLSFPAFWVLWFGQLDGLVMLGAALGFWAVQQKRPVVLGLALALLLVKPHIGGPLALLYLFWSRNWKAPATFAAVVLLSMLMWGEQWPYIWLRNLLLESGRGATAAQETNISLFPYGLLAWLVLLAPLNRPQRAVVVLAATFLSTPYAPIYSLLILLVMPLPWWVYVLSSAPYGLGPTGYKIATLAPVGVLGWILWPWFQQRWTNFKVR
jgi:hypothetical protein